jgi:hypothetical protein
MANNYYQATLTPDSIHLNEMQATYLEMTGASFEKESDGRYYVFWRDCLDEDNIDEHVATALDDGDIDQQMADAIGKLSFRELLRDILNNPANVVADITHLRIDGAWTCDKMRPGEFGGAATVVTRAQYCDMNTGSVFYNKDTGKIEFRFCDVVDFKKD